VIGSILRSGAALLVSASLWACSQSAEPQLEQLGTGAQAIIDGAPAAQSKYAAVGALVFTAPDGAVTDMFCSGTLVAPRAVVTARHCTGYIDLARLFGVETAFAFGSDAFQPTQAIPITSYVAAPPAPGEHKGLLLDGGRDVAVVYLASSPAHIRPVKLGRFSQGMLGRKFQIAGFGISDATGSFGKKVAGLATARALEGRWYKLLFDGDYDAYFEWYFTDSPLAFPSEEEARDWWKLYKLEPGFELLAGGLPGEAVGCFGDSGGPLLLGTKASNMTLYGVGFGGEATISTGCGLGGAYLVFNKKMFKFVRDAL
jgi:Trypsin